MLNKIRNSIRDIISVYPVLPQLTAAERTRRSWARSIATFDEVPDTYKPFLETLLSPGIKFPYTILTPGYEGFIRRETEKLVCVFDHEIQVLIKSGSTCEVQNYPLDGISHLEVRVILLDSHIRISGSNKQGRPISTMIRFNTVTDYLFRPMLEKIRIANAGIQTTMDRPNLEQFDKWMDANYKFMNYARRSILPGETVIHSVLQPEIREAVPLFFGKMSRALSPTHAGIVTDRELILIREELRVRGDEKYGGIWDYIPLKKIVHLSLKEKKSSLLALSIQLAGGDSIERLFESSRETEIRQWVTRIQEITIV